MILDYLKLACFFPALMFAVPLVAQDIRPESDGHEQTAANRCPGTGISIDRNMCFSDVLRRVEERRMDYLAAALRRYQYQQELVDLIVASDTAFAAYRSAECAAASKWWHQDEDKSIGVFAQLNCEIELTDQRTLQIWQNFLQIEVDVPPILPEPKPYPIERVKHALW